MAVKKRIERPAQVIKVNVTPVSQTVKAKVATAFQAVVDAIKTKHLS